VDDGALGAVVVGPRGAGDGVGAGDVATVEGAPHATAANAAIKKRDNLMDDPVLRGQ
jgi:hypothetical protein